MRACVSECVRACVWNPWSHSANKRTNENVTFHGTCVHKPEKKLLAFINTSASVSV